MTTKPPTASTLLIEVSQPSNSQCTELLRDVDELVERRLLLEITPELISSIETELVKDLQQMLRKKTYELYNDQWKYSYQTI
jgi:hemoglobin-like flavoprotein